MPLKRCSPKIVSVALLFLWIIGYIFLMQTIRITPKDSVNQALFLYPGEDITISFAPGIYREKVEVNRDNVTFVGDDALLVYGDHHGLVRDSHPLGTGESATLTIRAKGFSALNMIFSNDFDYPRYHAFNLASPDAKVGTQAVAVRTAGSADNTRFRACTFSGYQDTLYLDAGYHFLASCSISGNVDFIFGSGKAWFEDCDLVVKPYAEESYLVAPSTRTGEAYGFVFFHCTIKAEDGAGLIYLGRPWHPSGSLDRTSQAAFLDCLFETSIESWTTMESCNAEGLKRVWTPEESIFLEWHSKGYGAESRCNLTDEAATQFLEGILTKVNEILAQWK